MNTYINLSLTCQTEFIISMCCRKATQEGERETLWGNCSREEAKKTVEFGTYVQCCLS